MAIASGPGACRVDGEARSMCDVPTPRCPIDFCIALLEHLALPVQATPEAISMVTTDVVIQLAPSGHTPNHGSDIAMDSDDSGTPEAPMSAEPASPHAILSGDLAGPGPSQTPVQTLTEAVLPLYVFGSSSTTTGTFKASGDGVLHGVHMCESFALPYVTWNACLSQSRQDEALRSDRGGSSGQREGSQQRRRAQHDSSRQHCSQLHGSRQQSYRSTPNAGLQRCHGPRDQLAHDVGTLVAFSLDASGCTALTGSSFGGSAGLTATIGADWGLPRATLRLLDSLPERGYSFILALEREIGRRGLETKYCSAVEGHRDGSSQEHSSQQRNHNSHGIPALTCTTAARGGGPEHRGEPNSSQGDSGDHKAQGDPLSSISHRPLDRVDSGQQHHRSQRDDKLSQHDSVVLGAIPVALGLISVPSQVHRFRIEHDAHDLLDLYDDRQIPPGCAILSARASSIDARLAAPVGTDWSLPRAILRLDLHGPSRTDRLLDSLSERSYPFTIAPEREFVRRSLEKNCCSAREEHSDGSPQQHGSQQRHHDSHAIPDPTCATAMRSGTHHRGRLNPGDMEVFVTTPKGTLTLSIWSSTTVGHIRALIRGRRGTHLAKQRLIFAGKQLQDGDMVSDYGIQKGSTLDLVSRLRGGMPAAAEAASAASSPQATDRDRPEQEATLPATPERLTTRARREQYELAPAPAPSHASDTGRTRCTGTPGRGCSQRGRGAALVASLFDIARSGSDEQPAAQRQEPPRSSRRPPGRATAPAVQWWFDGLRTTVASIRRAGAVRPDFTWSSLTNPLIWGTVHEDDFQILVHQCREMDMGTDGVRRVRAWWNQRGVDNLVSAHRVLCALAALHGPWATYQGERRPVRAPDHPGAYIPDVLQEIVMAEARAGDLAMMEAFHPASDLRREAHGAHAALPAPPDFQRPLVQTRRELRPIDVTDVAADGDERLTDGAWGGPQVLAIDSDSDEDALNDAELRQLPPEMQVQEPNPAAARARSQMLTDASVDNARAAEITRLLSGEAGEAPLLARGTTDIASWLAQAIWVTLPCHLSQQLLPALVRSATNAQPFRDLAEWFAEQGCFTPAGLARMLSAVSRIQVEPYDPLCPGQIAELLQTTYLDLDLFTALSAGQTALRRHQASTSEEAGTSLARGNEHCTVCLEPFGDGDGTRWPGCGHRMHAACMQEWRRQRAGVPPPPRVRPHEWFPVYCPACRLPWAELDGDPPMPDAAASQPEPSAARDEDGLAFPESRAVANEAGQGGVAQRAAAAESSNDHDQAATSGLETSPVAAGRSSGDSMDDRLPGAHPTAQGSRGPASEPALVADLGGDGITATDSVAPAIPTGPEPGTAAASPAAAAALRDVEQGGTSPYMVVAAGTHALVGTRDGDALDVPCLEDGRDAYYAAAAGLPSSDSAAADDLPPALLAIGLRHDGLQALRAALAAADRAVDILAIACRRTASPGVATGTDLCLLAHAEWGARNLAMAAHLTAVGQPLTDRGRAVQCFALQVPLRPEPARPPVETIVTWAGAAELASECLHILLHEGLDPHVHAALLRFQAATRARGLSMEWATESLRPGSDPHQAGSHVAPLLYHAIRVTSAPAAPDIATLGSALAAIQHQGFTLTWWRDRDTHHAVHIPMARGSIPAAVAAAEEPALQMGGRVAARIDGLLLLDLLPAVTEGVVRAAQLDQWISPAAPASRILWAGDAHRPRGFLSTTGPTAGHDLLWLVVTRNQVSDGDVARRLQDPLAHPVHVSTVNALDPSTDRFDNMSLVRVAAPAADRMRIQVGSSGQVTVAGVPCRAFPFGSTRIRTQGHRAPRTPDAIRQLLAAASRPGAAAGGRSTTFSQVAQRTPLEPSGAALGPAVPRLLEFRTGPWPSGGQADADSSADVWTRMLFLGTVVHARLWVPAEPTRPASRPPPLPLGCQDHFSQTLHSSLGAGAAFRQEGGVSGLNGWSDHLLPGELLLVRVAAGSRLRLRAPGEELSWTPTLPAWIAVVHPAEADGRAAAHQLDGFLHGDVELADGPVWVARRPPSGPALATRRAAAAPPPAAAAPAPTAPPRDPRTFRERLQHLGDPPAPPGPLPSALVDPARAAARLALQPVADTPAARYADLLAHWLVAHITASQRPQPPIRWQWAMLIVAWLLEVLGIAQLWQQDAGAAEDLLTELQIGSPARRRQPFEPWQHGRRGVRPGVPLPGSRVQDAASARRHGHTSYALSAEASAALDALVHATLAAQAPGVSPAAPAAPAASAADAAGQDGPGGTSGMDVDGATLGAPVPSTAQ
ncbi:unnamed protein product, partial [Prorocentrum cordatum]